VQRWWAFSPYGVVALVHLVALWVSAEAVAGWTKTLLMPALLVGLLIALPDRRGRIALFAGVALALSWVGDLLVAGPGEGDFVLGLVGFLLAHVTYLVLFLGPLKTRRMPWLALLLVPWWLGLVLVLGPHLGVFLVPVALYGLVLGGSTAASLGTNAVTGAGGILFLLSDSVLAFKLFWPGFELWQADVAVMLPYVLGQGLIVVGTVWAARAREGS
jgi:alkenylglycerophosphocholine/alkenylglycerophosphoethanolamine hydrolase